MNRCTKRQQSVYYWMARIRKAGDTAQLLAIREELRPQQDRFTSGDRLMLAESFALRRLWRNSTR